MSLNPSFCVILFVFIHEASSLYPADRWFFPIDPRETPENVLSDSVVNLSGGEVLSSSSGSSLSADYIRNSELVRFVDYSSILGSPLASLSSPLISGESSAIKRDENLNGSAPSTYSIGKSIICNEDTVESSFSVVSLTRHHDNEKSKETARHRIMGHFWKYGLETYAQRFSTRLGLNGVNLIGIWPGKHRNKTGDSIILVGGHYDTVKGTYGIDDNGSGIVALLELVRLVGQSKPSLDHSIFFVAFDFEEAGLWGSKAFVCEYLIPDELIGKQANFMGAYITDMILTWDPTEGSQSFSDDFIKETPDAVSKVQKNKNRGDFASIWMRRSHDRSIWEPLERSWNRIANATDSGTKYKIIAFDADLPDKMSMKKKDIRESAQTFLRSDHSSFWYHGNRKMRPLNALLITDLGPWRGYQKSCYHKPCDDLSQITRDKLGFVVHIVLTLHDLITINPPTASTNNKRRDSSSSNSGYPLPRKPLHTSLNWPLNRRTSLMGLDGLYNNRGFTDANWLPGASDHRFIASDPRPPSTWSGSKFFKPWPTIKPSVGSSLTHISSDPQSPSSYDLSDFNSRAFTSPWYSLINRRSDK